MSATGSDASTTCSISAPCATFASAITKTSAGGEIDVLTSGSYGAITISEPVTIYASGVNAVIDFTGSEGVYIDNTSATAGPVVLHGLDINGESTGSDAVFEVGTSEASPVYIEDCDLYGFADIGVGVGDEGTSLASNSVTVENSTINGGTLGVRTSQTSPLYSASSPDQVVLDNDVIENASSAGVFTRGSAGQLVADHDLIEDNAVGFEAGHGAGELHAHQRRDRIQHRPRRHGVGARRRRPPNWCSTTIRSTTTAPTGFTS